MQVISGLKCVPFYYDQCLNNFKRTMKKVSVPWHGYLGYRYILPVGRMVKILNKWYNTSTKYSRPQQDLPYGWIIPTPAPQTSPATAKQSTIQSILHFPKCNPNSWGLFYSSLSSPFHYQRQLAISWQLTRRWSPQASRAQLHLDMLSWRRQRAGFSEALLPFFYVFDYPHLWEGVGAMWAAEQDRACWGVTHPHKPGHTGFHPDQPNKNEDTKSSSHQRDGRLTSSRVLVLVF